MKINFYVYQDSGRDPYAAKFKATYDQAARSNDRGTFQTIDSRQPVFSFINKFDGVPVNPSLILGVEANGKITPVAAWEGASVLNNLTSGEVFQEFITAAKTVNTPPPPTTGGDTPPPVVTQAGFGNIGLIVGGLAVAYFLFNR